MKFVQDVLLDVIAQAQTQNRTYKNKEKILNVASHEYAN